MARIAWNTAGSRFYEAGVDRGVLYIDSFAGVPWIGLISVDETPSGGEAKPYYVDGIKYLNISNAEEFEATIRAYTYPVEFSQCDGTARIRPGLFFGQQQRKSFGFSYRTKIGNDTSGSDYGYKLHLVYNALATPSSRTASSYGESAEASDFNWNLTTKPVAVSGYSPTAHIVVDSRFTHPLTVAAIENILYGNDLTVARLPTAQELIAIFDLPVDFTVADIDDGMYFITGPDSNILDVGLGAFVLNHSSISEVDEGSYLINY